MHLCPFFAEITKGGKEEMSFFLVDGATVRDGGMGMENRISTVQLRNVHH